MKTILSFILILVLFTPSYSATLSLKGDYDEPNNRAPRYTGISRLSETVETLSFYVEYGYGEEAKVVTKDEGSIGVNYDKDLSKLWDFWLDFNTGFNKVLDIKQEIFLGLGPKLTLFDNDDYGKCTFSAGALYQQEMENSINRASYRPKCSSKYFSFVYYYQPNMIDSKDYISKGEVEIQLTEILSIYYIDEYRWNINI